MDPRRYIAERARLTASTCATSRTEPACARTRSARVRPCWLAASYSPPVSREHGPDQRIHCQDHGGITVAAEILIIPRERRPDCRVGWVSSRIGTGESAKPGGIFDRIGDVVVRWPLLVIAGWIAFAAALALVVSAADGGGQPAGAEGPAGRRPDDDHQCGNGQGLHPAPRGVRQAQGSGRQGRQGSKLRESVGSRRCAPDDPVDR